MKVITLVPGTAEPHLSDRPEPGLQTANDIKLRVIDVGICGTDRAEAGGGRADAPPGASDLVIGHEMLGQIVEVGSDVNGIKPGAFGALTVRRPCDHCDACKAGRPDLCESGDYTERGIKARDGYNAEFVVDSASNFIPVDAAINGFGVLAEPMSIAQKAITEALHIQAARLPAANKKNWLSQRHVLVAGLGPVGLLAAIDLSLSGARVLGLDVVDEDNPRVQILKAIGGEYIDGRETMPAKLAAHYHNIDLIFEATGIAHLEFDLLGALATNGVYVLTGIPEGARPIEVSGASLVRNFVLENQVMVGSVNASHEHFLAAVSSLSAANRRWPGVLDRLITRRVKPGDAPDALKSHAPGEIKAVIHWSDAQVGVPA